MIDREALPTTTFRLAQGSRRSSGSRATAAGRFAREVAESLGTGLVVAGLGLAWFAWGSAAQDASRPELLWPEGSETISFEMPFEQVLERDGTQGGLQEVGRIERARPAASGSSGDVDTDADTCVADTYIDTCIDTCIEAETDPHGGDFVADRRLQRPPHQLLASH
jgi:hypothetical protein